MSKPKFPITVKRGHTVVKIYHTPSRGCDAYTVVYYLGTKRQRKSFADLGLATTEAEVVANKLSTGEVNVLTLTSDDRLSYIRAIEALKPTGVPLEMAAMQFAEAHKLLEGVSLLEAARFYLKKNPHRGPKKLVPVIVKEMVEAKEADKMSAVYVKDLKGRLGRFAEKFPGAISFVTSVEIEDFLRGLKGKDKDGKETIVLSGKSRNNYRRAIGTLFNYAVSRGYLPKGSAEVEDVTMAREENGEIEIFRPDELANLLAAADPSLIPFLTIGAFAGLRHAELQRLDWSEVRLDDGFIEVKASKAKTASRRLVPSQDNLKQWLTPLRKAGGPIFDYANMSKQLLWLSEALDKKLKEADSTAAFVWKHNALRHSFISYRVAQTQNVAQVALEAGNSPRVVFSNYRELVRPADAAKWFGIAPDAEAKVIPMTKAAVA
jgi:integrase